MDIGHVIPREITDEMRESYLDYAMSVIVARALPDVRDGLKPVHRRILYSMHEMGLTAAAKYRKSAAVVGNVLGHYHPHGDSAVYDAMMRMAQDFSLRYPLVDGQGNLGSIDGDAPAAMRYTEARMSKITAELLRDIEKETVEFRPNYDNTRSEPTVLPAALPNLLLNGTVGIAVGMATNIPPHNLGEVVEALLHLAKHPDCSIEDLMEYVKGPDFPTAGLMFDEAAIRTAYAIGKGPILTRGKAEIIHEGPSATSRREGPQIIITEIPYQVNKAELIKTIAGLVEEKRVEGIRDLRDESDRDGLRIAIDLKTDAAPQKILNSLYKYTDLERHFHLNMLALVDGIQPQVLSLKGILEEFLKHRTIVVTRRTKFDLARTEERIHILEGLKRALDHIDAVIQTIKKSADRDEAHAALQKKFEFSDRQATAILDMRLATLAGLERQKIEDELKEKIALARSLAALLKDPKKILAVIEQELNELKTRYGDLRRTALVKHSPKSFSEEDLIADEEVVVVLTRGGQVKRLKPESYRMQRRGGKGLIGIETKEEDVVEHLLTVRTHDTLLFFTDAAKVYQSRAYEIPEGTRISKGRAILNVIGMNAGERVTSILAITNTSARAGARGVGKTYVVMLTKFGMMKKVSADAFGAVRKSGLIALTLKKDDALGWARLTSGSDDLVIVTKSAQAIRFAESDVRAMGRTAAGVHALKLREGDIVVGMDAVDRRQGKTDAQRILVVTERGYGKQSAVSEFKKQKRGGSGIKAAKLTAKTGAIVGASMIREEATELIAISRKGQVIRTELGSVPVLGRVTQGVRIMRLDAGDAVASVTTL